MEGEGKASVDGSGVDDDDDAPLVGDVAVGCEGGSIMARPFVAEGSEMEGVRAFDMVAAAENNS